MRLKAPIPYFGGKQRMANKLLPLFPSHQTYVEVFGGAAALLIAKTPSPVEVYNDRDGDLVNFMQVLKDQQRQFPDFYERVCLSPYSRDEWQFCRDHLHDDPDPVERARRFFVMARFGFGGLLGHAFGITITSSSQGMVQQASSYKGVLDILPRISERLASVHIEQRDFRELIRRYDRPETFFYLDPPYLPETRRSGSYTHEMTLEDHRTLVAILRNLKGKALLSGYPNTLYDGLGWNTHRWATTCHAAGRTRTSGLQGVGAVSRLQQRTECAWTNY